MIDTEIYAALKSILDSGETRGPDDFIFLATEKYIEPVVKDDKMIWGLTECGKDAYMRLNSNHDYIRVYERSK